MWLKIIDCNKKTMKEENNSRDGRKAVRSNSSNLNNGDVVISRKRFWDYGITFLLLKHALSLYV
jgi:hypothetical protein